MGTKSHHKVFLFTALLFIITPLAMPLLHAQTYYADLSITVDSSGFITIEGPTNYPNLTTTNTQNYTSKQHSLWLLNITKPEIFSQLIYTITLPRGSTINYIKALGLKGIEENQGRLIVRGFGENESLSILIQYQTEKIEDVSFQDIIVYLILFSLILLVCFLLVYFYRKEKKTKPSETKIEHPGEWKGLNHRQIQIMQLLKERNIPLTQTDLQKELQIPKASVSRNIRGLEKRGLIEKESIGMSNLIRLKKP